MPDYKERYEASRRETKMFQQKLDEAMEQLAAARAEVERLRNDLKLVKRILNATGSPRRLMVQAEVRIDEALAEIGGGDE